MQEDAKTHSKNSPLLRGIQSPRLSHADGGYIPSAERETFLNSKVPTNMDLRQMTEVVSGRKTPSQVSAHVRNVLGLKRVSPMARNGIAVMAAIQELAS